MTNPIRTLKEMKAKKRARTKADKVTKKKARKRKNDSESDDDMPKKKPKGLIKKPIKVCPKNLKQTSSQADIDFNGNLYWRDVAIHVVRLIQSELYKTINEVIEQSKIAFGKRKI